MHDYVVMQPTNLDGLAHLPLKAALCFDDNILCFSAMCYQRYARFGYA